MSIATTIATIVEGSVKILWPKKSASIPETMWTVLAQLIDSTWNMVQELRAAESLTGEEKIAAVVEAIRKLADEGLDDVPGWSDLGEDARDRIISGVAETAYQIACSATNIPEVTEERVNILVSSVKNNDVAPLIAVGLSNRASRVTRVVAKPIK